MTMSCSCQEGWDVKLFCLFLCKNNKMCGRIVSIRRIRGEMSRRVINDKVLILNAGVLAGVTAVIGGILGGKNISAESATANATVTVGSACTMTATVDPAHTAEVPAGSTKTNIGSTTLNTICNDAGGYAIYAVGYSGDEYGNNKMLNGTNEINTGTGTSASNWNMSLSQVTTGTYATTIDGGFGSYSAIPATYTKVAHRDSMTDSTAGSSISLTYGAYVASTQAPGDYVGKVKFTMVHPATEVPPQPVACASGRICYNPNGTNVIGTMGSPSIASSATSAMLLANNFSRKGYGFAGWSDKFDYGAGAKFYGPQEDINFTAGQYSGTNPGLSLYAVWVKSEGSIQDASKVTSICSRLTKASTDGAANLASVSALTDQRDNETYAIAKLADGNCWMIENLRLEADNTRTAEKQALAQGYGSSTTYGDFTGLANAESDNFTNTNPPPANSLYSTDGSTTNTIKGGNSSVYYTRMPRYNNVNTQSRASSPTGNTVAMYSYGNYYTWAAAMASVIEYAGTTAQVDGKTSETANTSLCPTGWRLPYGGSTGNGATTGGLYNLYYKINNDTDVTDSTASLKLRSFPNNFLYSGSFSTSTAANRGRYGFYWSSSADGSSIGSYYLYLGSSNVIPGNGGVNKLVGNSIRCTVGS